MTELSQQEQDFLYNLDVLGMTQSRAAELAGLGSNPSALLKKPTMLAARDELRVALRGNVQITREDVIAGYKKAIEKADLIDEPLAMIAGWREIAKMLGYEAPKEIHHHLTGTVTDMRRQLSQLTDAELLDQLGPDASDVLDGEFVRIEHHDNH